jgi:hypothetical protein
MLRVHLMQNGFGYSDPAMQEGWRGPVASYTQFLITDGRGRPETAPKDEPCPCVVVKNK